jgi:hypothetical protein
MKLTDEAIKAVLDGCEQSSGVTPGPWRRYAKSPHVARDTSQPDPHPNVGSVVVAECGNYRDKELVPFNMKRWLADAAHISRCDPDTIRSAFTELLEARAALAAKDAEIERLVGINRGLCASHNSLNLDGARLEGIIRDKNAEIERITKERDEAIGDQHRRGVAIIGMVETGGALLCRAEAAEARVAELEGALKSIKADLPYVMGWNEGFEHAFSETLRFPTMPRKMWAGSEVQSWLDEQRKIAMAGREENL